MPNNHNMSQTSDESEINLIKHAIHAVCVNAMP